MKKVMILALLAVLMAGCAEYTVDYDVTRVDMIKNSATVKVWVKYENGFTYDFIHYGEYSIGLDTFPQWKLAKDKDCEQLIEFHKQFIKKVE